MLSMERAKMVHLLFLPSFLPPYRPPARPPYLTALFTVLQRRRRRRRNRVTAAAPTAFHIIRLRLFRSFFLLNSTHSRLVLRCWRRCPLFNSTTTTTTMMFTRIDLMTSKRRSTKEHTQTQTGRTKGWREKNRRTTSSSSS